MSSLEHTEQVSFLFTICYEMIPYTSILYRPTYHVYRAGLVTVNTLWKLRNSLSRLLRIFIVIFPQDSNKPGSGIWSKKLVFFSILSLSFRFSNNLIMRENLPNGYR